MSGELKVDIISPNTVGQDVQINGNMNADTITANNDLTVKGILNVEGNITGNFDMFFPIGTIMPFDKSFPNLPTLSGPFVECNGQFINDADSLLHGYRTRNLNGAEVSMELIWESNTGGSRTTVSELEITALSVGDDVSGTGISDGTYITEIVGTTIVINDTTVNNIVTTTFTSDGDFIRGGMNSGLGQKDSFQGHSHIDGFAGVNHAATYGVAVTGHGNINNQNGQSQYNHAKTSGPITDGVHGNPRIALETRPINLSMVYIMRIK